MDEAERAADAVPLSRMIACVEREIRLRRRAYPRWVEQGKMRAGDAACETWEMLAVLGTLRRLAGPQPVQGDLLP